MLQPGIILNIEHRATEKICGTGDKKSSLLTVFSEVSNSVLFLVQKDSPISQARKLLVAAIQERSFLAHGLSWLLRRDFMIPERSLFSGLEEAVTAAQDAFEWKSTNVFRFKPMPSHIDIEWHRWYIWLLNLFFVAHYGKHVVQAWLTGWFLNEIYVRSKCTHETSVLRAWQMSSARLARGE